MFFYQNVLAAEPINFTEAKLQQELTAVWNSIPTEAAPITNKDGIQVGTCKEVSLGVCIIYSNFDHGYMLEVGGFLDRLRSSGFVINVPTKSLVVKGAKEAAG